MTEQDKIAAAEPPLDCRVMRGLEPGEYRTAAGSMMTISGKHGGRSAVVFDWLEEGACCECTPEPYEDGGFLVWYCDECGGGRAPLIAVHNASLTGA